MSGLTQRSSMQPAFCETRAYFAPVDRSSGNPAPFDPALHYSFAPDAPPRPWIDVGAIRGFKRESHTEVKMIGRGKKGAAVSQYRSALAARLEFEFCHWGKLQMALAGGAQHFNVLAKTGNAVDAAVAVLAGSTPSSIVVGANASKFQAGDMIAVDLDYTGQTGFIGSGVAAAFASSGTVTDVNFIRRVTFNVGRVSAVTSNALTLAQPLIGGSPLPDAFAQKIVAFTDREGGSFFHEWSALFVVTADGGPRVCIYYPRLQACAPAAESTIDAGREVHLTTLRAAFLALPVNDSADGEQVVCYRTYVPVRSAALY